MLHREEREQQSIARNSTGAGVGAALLMMPEHGRKKPELLLLLQWRRWRMPTIGEVSP